MSQRKGIAVEVLTRVALALALLTGVVDAEPTISATASPAASETKIVGGIDFRPSMRLGDGSLHTENSLELGYQFARGRILSYMQYFETNLSNPSAEISGMNTAVYDGTLRARLGKLLENKDLGLSFSYENRLYLPISQLSRDQGMLTTVRNYFTVAKKLNDSVTLSLSEIPILGIYDRPGILHAGGGATANMMFENRVYVTIDIALSDALSLSLPLQLYQTKARRMAGASNDGAWTFTAMIYPELSYALADNIYLGVAYYSSNLIAPDFTRTTIQDGIGAGTIQAVLGATL